MAIVKGTVPAQMVKHIGHSPEGLTTPGVADPNGIYVHCGYDSDITETATVEHEDAPLFTSYDLVCSSLMGLTYNWGLTFKAFDDVLLKWMCNLPAGVGTMAQTKTFLYSQLINGVEKFKLFKGCLPTSITCRVTKPSIQCTVAGRASTITDFQTTHTLTSPNLAALTAALSGCAWAAKDCGTNPLQIASVAMPAMEFTFTVTWTLATLEPLGLTTYQEIGPTARRITLEFLTYRKGDPFLADLNSYTPVAVDFKIHNSAPAVWARFTNAYKVSYTPVNMTAGGAEFIGERVGMIAQGVTITNT